MNLDASYAPNVIIKVSQNFGSYISAKEFVKRCIFKNQAL